MVACMFSHTEVAMELLAVLKLTSNFDINDTNNYSSTVLMFSCTNSDVALTRLLLSVPRIDIRLKNKQGMTALEHAKRTANEDEIRALFQGELPCVRFC
jgi:ankyrin repeat protein